MMQTARAMTRVRAFQRCHLQLRAFGEVSVAATNYTEALRISKAPPRLGPDGIVQLDVAKEPCYTLPAAAYTSKAILEEEHEKIFGKCWSFIGHTSDFPSAGSYATARLGNEELFLVRDKEGTIRAFFNVCPHRGHRLVEPGSSGSRPVVICPNHAWSFKLDGTLHKARKTEGQAPFDPIRWGLKQIRLEHFNGLLFGNLSDDAPPLFADSPGLKEQIAEEIVRMKEMKVVSVVEKYIDANWKILVENFLECYHCDTVHKDLVTMFDMEKYSTTVGANHVYNLAPCEPNNKAYRFSENAPCKSFTSFWLYPNTVVYSAPGDPNMSVFQFLPISESRSLRRVQRFFVPEADDAKAGDEADAKTREAAVEYLNKVLLEEDTSLCESMQKGLLSRAYKQGRLCVAPNDASWETEKSLAQFAAVYNAQMTR